MTSDTPNSHNLKVEQFYYGPKQNGNLNYEQTDGVSTLLPEDKIVELYNIGNQTNKPLETAQLHQTVYGAPVISVTFAAPITDSKGRQTTFNRTFLISLKDITDALLTALRPFSQDKNEKLEPLEIAKFTISNPKDTRH